MGLSEYTLDLRGKDGKNIRNRDKGRRKTMAKIGIETVTSR